jgi:hypothetical protein
MHERESLSGIHPNVVERKTMKSFQVLAREPLQKDGQFVSSSGGNERSETSRDVTLTEFCRRKSNSERKKVRDVDSFRIPRSAKSRTAIVCIAGNGFEKSFQLKLISRNPTSNCKVTKIYRAINPSIWPRDSIQALDSMAHRQHVSWKKQSVILIIKITSIANLGEENRLEKGMKNLC